MAVMQSVLTSIIDSWIFLGMWLGGFFVVFTLLARCTPCNRDQSILRKDSFTDLAYCFIIPIFTRLVRLTYIGLGIIILFHGAPENSIKDYLLHGYGPLAELPVWQQAAIIFIVSDIILYWTHRMFHGRRLWRFHAIHHSSPKVDWLSTFRFHPVNTWLSFTLVDSLMVLVGFSPAAVALLGTFNLMYSAMVHANLNWTFGPFRHIFASPVFHRWHHTAQEEGMDKNFAPTFPLLDIVFGTFYMPEGKLPEHFGVPGSGIPDTFRGQLMWPFKQT